MSLFRLELAFSWPCSSSAPESSETEPLSLCLMDAWCCCAGSSFGDGVSSTAGGGGGESVRPADLKADLEGFLGTGGGGFERFDTLPRLPLGRGVVLKPCSYGFLTQPLTAGGCGVGAGAVRVVSTLVLTALLFPPFESGMNPGAVRERLDPDCPLCRGLALGCLLRGDLASASSTGSSLCLGSEGCGLEGGAGADILPRGESSSEKGEWPSLAEVGVEGGRRVVRSLHMSVRSPTSPCSCLKMAISVRSESLRSAYWRGGRK